MTTELELIAQTAKQFCARHGGASVLRARRASQADDSELFAACVEQGFSGVALSEAWGGMGLGWQGLSVLLVEGGQQLLELPVLSATQLPIEALLACPGSALRDELLKSLGQGDQRLAVAWQSDAHHPNPYEPSVQAALRDGQWVLSGVSNMVLGAIGADGFLVSAQTDQGGILLRAPRTASGLEVHPQALMDHRNCARLVFSNVQVETTQVLASSPDTAAVLDRLLDAGRLGLAAQMMGGAVASYDQTLDYLKTRKQFGVVIGSFQALQHRIAQVFIRIQLAQAGLRQGVAQFDLGGTPRAQGAALAKAQCGEAYALAAKEGVQMHGGIGVTDEHDIGFHLKSSQVGNTLWGEPASMRSLWASLAGY